MVRAPPERDDSFGTVTKGFLSAVLAALLVILAGCANSGAPTSYDDNLADYQFDENSEVETGVGQPERNFREGCKESGRDNIDEQVKTNLAKVCKCSFDKIKETKSFEEFKQLDKDLRSNINAALPEDVERVMRQCIREKSGL